ncbi:MAG: DEAD/DEAH box helicase family protein [Gammaproteobacteria bacterium]|nr:DEAD/DEAH box helicase family protein [Gammaproteobacteria bacterium]
MTISPTLYEPERQVLEQAVDLSDDETAHRVAEVFVHGGSDIAALSRHALDCLGWMLATRQLNLRIAVPQPGSNFHPKMWGFGDDRDYMIANGSGNATGHGVVGGVEQMTVTVSWDDHDTEVFERAKSALDDWFYGRSLGISRVFDLPEAVEARIIETAPDVAPRESDYFDAVEADGNPSWAADPHESLRRRFARTATAILPALQIPDWLRWRDGAFAHQGEAVDAWETADPPERGILEMATGAGKTLTALVCATRAQQRVPDRPLLLVVSAPSRALVAQWRSEIAKFGLRAIAPVLESSSDIALSRAIRQLRQGGTVAIVVTNVMLCDHRFQSTIEMAHGDASLLLIADEAHGLGADGFVNSKPEFFEKRLALTATPIRQYDPDGTEEIFDYFGEPVYQFGLDRAIGFCLTPYRYYVHAATLEENELDEYVVLTKRIGAAIGQEDEERRDALLIRRRRVIETAEAKYSLLKRVLRTRGTRELSHALVYASAKNPEQYDRIAELLDELGIRWAGITQATSAAAIQKAFEAFAAGGFQVLLAKKLLDEGVDIPATREAFIVASSSVEREWIQRRGRVLRQHPDKPFAIVHDFVALPPAGRAATEISLRPIIDAELNRAYAFARHAGNPTGSTGAFANIGEIREAYWPSGSRISSHLQNPGEMYVAPGTPEGAPW